MSQEKKKSISIELPNQHDGKKKFTLTFRLEVLGTTTVKANAEDEAWEKAEKLCVMDELEFELDDIFDTINIEPESIKKG